MQIVIYDHCKTRNDWLLFDFCELPSHVIFIVLYSVYKVTSSFLSVVPLLSHAQKHSTKKLLFGINPNFHICFTIMHHAGAQPHSS